MRVGIALLGVGTVAAASILPGTLAVADSEDDVHVAVTRAVLAQGDVNGELSRTTLVTQIQIDGEGQTSFTVPAPDGATPKDMDAFGGPEVEDGNAQYNLDVDGAQSQRTAQSYDQDELPVTVAVSATLNGEAVDPGDLAGSTGLATLSYTVKNHTAERTKVSHKDGAGNTVTETLKIPTPMAGTLDFEFDDSWIEITSDESDSVAQNGQGGTVVSATVALMAPPAGDTEASVTIEGRVDNAVVPPADIKVAIIDPLETGAGQDGEALAKKTGDGLTLLYEGMELLSSPTEGLGALAAGLGEAVSGANQIADGVGSELAPGVVQLSDGLGLADDGANEIADGVADLLGPGIHELRLKAAVDGHQDAITASETLVGEVRGQSSYQELLSGFDTLNSDKALFKIQDTMLKMRPKFGPPFTAMPVTNAGWPDMANATVPGSLNALTFGITQKSLDSLGNGDVARRPINGLTNPTCDMNDPLNVENPCGGVQVLDLALGQIAPKSIHGPGNPAGASAGLSFTVPEDCQKELLACAGKVMDPILGKMVPGPNTPGGSAVADLLPQIMVDGDGYQPRPTTDMIGKDKFGTKSALTLGEDSILNLLDGTDFGKGVCKVTGQLSAAPIGGPSASYPFSKKELDQIQAVLVSCGGSPLPDFDLSKVGSLAFLSGQFTAGLADSLGRGLRTDGRDSAHNALRFALGQMRTGFTAEDSGWPTGCHPGANPPNGLFEDPYGCNLNAEELGRGMLDDKKFTATNTALALEVNLGKTANNPGGQIPQGSAGWSSYLAFGECPGPEASDAKVETHCSANQVLQFLAAGIAGKDQVAVSNGKVAAGCPVVSSKPWNVPQDGDDPGTVPTPPSTDKVERYGVTCGVRTLQQSIDRIMLPGIGNGVQQETLGLIGSGQYTPNCDPTVTGTLTCALSVLDEGVNGSSPTSLLNGTQTLADGMGLLDAGGQLLNDGVTILKDGTRLLADGLPVAEAGAQAATDGVTDQMMPPVNDSVEEANQAVAVLETLSEIAHTGANVPGGAAEGVDTNQGVYAFEFAGAGGAVDSSAARFGLGALLLLLAGGLGWFLSTRGA